MNIQGTSNLTLVPDYFEYCNGVRNPLQYINYTLLDESTGQDYSHLLSYDS